jgi:hypothetical protein
MVLAILWPCSDFFAMSHGNDEVFTSRYYHMNPFLKLRCEAQWWKEAVAKPHARGDGQAIVRLRAVLAPLMLRRTKVCTAEIKSLKFRPHQLFFMLFREHWAKMESL